MPVCSVGYVPKYTEGNSSVITLPNHTRVFGTVAIPVPNTPVRFGTNSIPVPDTSVSSVRPQYWYPTIRSGYYTVYGGYSPDRSGSVRPKYLTVGKFGTTSIPVPGTSVSSVQYMTCVQNIGVEKLIPMTMETRCSKVI